MKEEERRRVIEQVFFLITGASCWSVVGAEGCGLVLAWGWQSVTTQSNLTLPQIRLSHRALMSLPLLQAFTTRLLHRTLLLATFTIVYQKARVLFQTKQV